MCRFADVLQRFDRKERNWLIRDALDNPKLSLDFRNRLQRALQEPLPGLIIPESAWWAIDFHWDWLFGALHVTDPLPKPMKNDGAITGSQEDVDLVVAFESSLILIEAKATGAWTNAQMRSKLARFERFLQEASAKLGDGFRIFFVLMSPRKPEKLSRQHSWRTHNGEFVWLRMRSPLSGGLLKVTRCTSVFAGDKDSWQVLNAPFSAMMT